MATNRAIRYAPIAACNTAITTIGVIPRNDCAARRSCGEGGSPKGCPGIARPRRAIGTRWRSLKKRASRRTRRPQLSVLFGRERLATDMAKNGKGREEQNGEQREAVISQVLRKNPALYLVEGRTAFYDASSNTLVIVDPTERERSIAFRPAGGVEYVRRLPGGRPGAGMQIAYLGGGAIELVLTLRELAALGQCLNEVCHGLGTTDFAKLFVERTVAERLLNTIVAAYPNTPES